jgi:tRNA(His) 5'-end guanylyltransferase
MKAFYEDRTRIFVPRKTYTLIRVDGKAFHTYTRGLKRPFDRGLIEDMNETASYLCKNIQGSKFAYVQSDEISVLVTDFDTITTDMWFDGNLQKMASVASSLATAKFNQLRMKRSCWDGADVDGYLDADDLEKFPLACFDARVFQIPQPVEVENYFIWRQQDAVRNSISSVAQSLYSHKELEGKSSNQKQEMIFQKGINWNDYTSREKRGGFIERVEVKVNPFMSPHAGLSKKGTGPGANKDTGIRKKWTSVECPIFTQNREFLKSRIPEYMASESFHESQSSTWRSLLDDETQNS